MTQDRLGLLEIPGRRVTLEITVLPVRLDQPETRELRELPDNKEAMVRLGRRDNRVLREARDRADNPEVPAIRDRRVYWDQLAHKATRANKEAREVKDLPDQMANREQLVHRAAKVRRVIRVPLEIQAVQVRQASKDSPDLMDRPVHPEAQVLPEIRDRTDLRDLKDRLVLPAPQDSKEVLVPSVLMVQLDPPDRLVKLDLWDQAA